MPGTWATTTVLNNDALGTTVGAQTVSRNLPTSNFIGRVTVKLHVVGTNTSTVTLDFIRVIAAGNATLISTEGGQWRGITKFNYGSVTPGVAVAATDQIWVLTLDFGRGYHDESMICVAKLYKQLQLQLTFTTAVAGITAIGLTITADEYYSNDDPRLKFVRTVNLVQTVASAASARQQVTLNRGRYLRCIYLHADHSANTNGFSPVYGGTITSTEPIRVKINNGAESPFDVAMDMLKISNQHTYRFDDADTPDTELTNAAAFTGTEEMVAFDFDPTDDMSHAINTAAVNDINVNWQVAAASSTGDTHILTDEFYPVVY